MVLIKMDKTKQLAELIGSNGNVQNVTVRMDGYPDIDVEMGDNKMLIVTKTKQLCIKVEFERTQIYLNDYYLESFIGKYKKECPEIEHDHFFRLLDFFSAVLKKGVYLIDASFKVLNQCSLSSIVLLFAKGRTFYQRYGFTMEKGSDLYTKYRHQAYAVYKNEENMARLQRLNDTLRRTMSRDTADNHQELQELLRLRKVSDALTTSDMTVEDVSTWFYILCNTNHPIIYTHRYDLEQSIANFVRDLKTNKDIFNGYYVQDVSKNRYKYTVDVKRRVIHVKLPKAIRYFKTRLYLCQTV